MTVSTQGLQRRHIVGKSGDIGLRFPGCGNVFVVAVRLRLPHQGAAALVIEVVNDDIGSSDVSTLHGNQQLLA